MKNFEKYFAAAAYLKGLSNLPLRSDYLVDHKHPGRYLDRMKYFLDLIGKPDRGVKFIHIAGTAGKGTVTTMIHEILHVAGKKVGSFTSPFVTTSIEKIKVGSKFISPNTFADIVEGLKPFIDESYRTGSYGRVSYFEICFAIALLYFQKRKCQWVVLEVGLADNKDSKAILEQIIPLADHVYFTRFQIKDRKCAHPKALLASSKQYLKKSARARIPLDPWLALSETLKIADKKDLILVTGSFFLVGELRKRWITEERILKNRIY